MEEVEPAIEVPPGGNSQPASDMDHHSENLVPHLANHEDAESKCKIREEEIIGIMEVIAATGKFWHDWDTLKSLLSFRLKQVLAQYPESQTITTTESRSTSLAGEIYPELVKRLDKELQSFTMGPPFTLQRLCEILLTPKLIYPNLSKLALALEKNLLVTSSLSMSTDPYPQRVAGNLTGQSVPSSGSGTIQDESSPVQNVGGEPNSNPVQNGVSREEGDADDEMTEAETVEDKSSSDVEMKEDETAETPSSSSELNTDPHSATEVTEPCQVVANMDSMDSHAS